MIMTKENSKERKFNLIIYNWICSLQGIYGKVELRWEIEL